jgi:hypothetical protein
MPKLNVPVEAIEAYTAFAKNDYAVWSRRGEKQADSVREQMIAKFDVKYEVGSSYIKVVHTSGYGNSSVHSFIVNKAGKFPIGAVLKPASWRGPATNFARADVLKPETWEGRIRWTGAL